ncbi:hypothetical protein [Burkholderia arboris]|uniref:Uncharacterized protein n=1 Tax=Burkholderia arboris TaxID=488730 RepID=A0ABZ3DPZ2_9BURK|nr:hypothetical protein [Burkholderia arboris]MCA8490503.1 hypothetical protein [Burkholderia arboris]UTV59363.1 hypothetical protein NLX30_24895 [Burkholderia arboris]
MIDVVDALPTCADARDGPAPGHANRTIAPARRHDRRAVFPAAFLLSLPFQYASRDNAIARRIIFSLSFQFRFVIIETISGE